MWCLFHKNQSLGKYVSIFTLTGPERKDSAGKGSVKHVSIREKKKSLFGIFGLVSVCAVKPHGVIIIPNRTLSRLLGCQQQGHGVSTLAYWDSSWFNSTFYQDFKCFSSAYISFPPATAVSSHDPNTLVWWEILNHPNHSTICNSSSLSIKCPIVHAHLSGSVQER